MLLDLPAIGSTDGQGGDAVVLVKLFTPDSSWSWFASEFDGDDLFFGLVIGLEIELGYFSLQELHAIHGPWGLPIERDLHFEPKSLRKLKEFYIKNRRM